MKHAKIVSIEMSAIGGSTVGDAIKDAMEYAVKEWKNVNLRHNDKIYSIKVNDLYAVVECSKKKK